MQSNRNISDGPFPALFWEWSNVQVSSSVSPCWVFQVMTAICTSEKEGILCCACLVLCSWMPDWKCPWQHKRNTTANTYVLYCIQHRIGKFEEKRNCGSTFYPVKIHRACVAVVNIQGYAMHWDSFTSSSKGNISDYKSQQVFSHATQVRNTGSEKRFPINTESIQAGSKERLIWERWPDAWGSILGEALLPSIGTEARRSVWELIHWHPQKGGTCYKLF